MCGHGMVSFNLIRKMIEQVRLRRMTPKQAARMMAKCCECGAFNPARAEALLDTDARTGLSLLPAIVLPADASSRNRFSP